MSMATGSWDTRSLAAALSESVAWKRCSPMVMLIFMRSSCGLSEVGVGVRAWVGLAVEGAPVGSRPVPVSVSPQPVPARTTTADSAKVRSVRDMRIEGIRSPVPRLSEGEQDLRGGVLIHRLVAVRAQMVLDHIGGDDLADAIEAATAGRSSASGPSGCPRQHRPVRPRRPASHVALALLRNAPAGPVSAPGC